MNTISLSSGAFRDGEMIPQLYTCDGDDISPDLSWHGALAGAKSFAIICDDPDAVGGDYVHWVVYNIPTEVKNLRARFPRERKSIHGITQGISDDGSIGYIGPCPPRGVHRYYFTIFAVDFMTSLDPGLTKKELLKRIMGHIVGEGRLMGRYTRERV
jgi:Raf kinase inhibitor-like YbhB/YbcL family protein